MDRVRRGYSAFYDLRIENGTEYRFDSERPNDCEVFNDINIALNAVSV